MAILRRTFLAMAAATIASPALALSGKSERRIETLTAFSEAHDVVPRIRVALPRGYDVNEQSYKTLYMLDGQYAFEGDSDGISFEADRRVMRLMDAGTIQPTIIVAIDNLGNDRFLQYMPESIYERASPEVRITVEREIERVGARSLSSNAFLEFIQNQLKPWIDTNYRTNPGRLNTAVFGASMAGVMSAAIF
ncbi:MAG: alpha/beta hydrolase-fold protein, partial [Alteraurantiacibacter sp.]